jgi:hypothetical protein
MISSVGQMPFEVYSSQVVGVAGAFPVAASELSWVLGGARASAPLQIGLCRSYAGCEREFVRRDAAAVRPHLVRHSMGEALAAMERHVEPAPWLAVEASSDTPKASSRTGRGAATRRQSRRRISEKNSQLARKE